MSLFVYYSIMAQDKSKKRKRRGGRTKRYIINPLYPPPLSINYSNEFASPVVQQIENNEQSSVQTIDPEISTTNTSLQHLFDESSDSLDTSRTNETELPQATGGLPLERPELSIMTEGLPLTIEHRPDLSIITEGLPAKRPYLNIVTEGLPAKRPHLNIVTEGLPAKRPRLNVVTEGLPAKRPHLNIVTEGLPAKRPYLNIVTEGLTPSLKFVTPPEFEFPLDHIVQKSLMESRLPLTPDAPSPQPRLTKSASLADPQPRPTTPNKNAVKPRLLFVILDNQRRIAPGVVEKIKIAAFKTLLNNSVGSAVDIDAFYMHDELSFQEEALLNQEVRDKTTVVLIALREHSYSDYNMTHEALETLLAAWPRLRKIYKGIVFAWYHSSTGTLPSYTTINIVEKRGEINLNITIKPLSNFRQMKDRQSIEGMTDLLGLLAHRMAMWHDAFLGTGLDIYSPTPDFLK